MKKKVIGMIPIKLNNERLPGKNLKQFYDGTSLIQYFLKKLLKVKGLDAIYVFCSDEVIQDYLLEKIIFLKRPEYLDTQAATPQAIIKEFINLIDADIYMVAHVTSPFVSIKHFEECIEAVVSGVFDSSFTGEKIQKFLWKNDAVPLNFNANNIPRTQDLKPIYAEVSASYVFRKDVFLNFNRRIGINAHITIVSGVESIDIDYPEDFEIANAIYKDIIMNRPPPPPM
jgi:CMP-N-acetylneuraminic acid synthetase